MPSELSRRARVAKLPRVLATPGGDQGDLLVEVGPAGRDLLGPGVAVAGRAAFDHVGDVHLSRRSPASSTNRRSSSCPDRPTKGRPWRSSSRPGPSPMTMRPAWGSPSPKTTVVRPLARAHGCRPRRPVRRRLAARARRRILPGGGCGTSVVIRPRPGSPFPRWRSLRPLHHPGAQGPDRFHRSVHRSRGCGQEGVTVGTCVCGIDCSRQPVVARLGDEQAIRLPERGVGRNHSDGRRL